MKAFEMRGTAATRLSGEGILRARKSGGVRKATLVDAGISFGFLIFVMSVSLVKFKLDPHIPMFLGVMIPSSFKSKSIPFKIGMVVLKYGFTHRITADRGRNDSPHCGKSYRKR